MQPWTYNEEVFALPEEKYYGFVYVITNLSNNKQYIGKKLFWHQKTKTLKGKKKRYLAESDWKTYYGSSPLLQSDIKHYGQDSFKREILHLCVSKGECTYYEAYEQMVRAVLFNPEMYYNDWIICKVHRKHLINEQGDRKQSPRKTSKQ